MTNSTFGKIAATLLSLCTLAIASIAYGQITPATGHSFRVEGDHFSLDGKPFRVLAGEMHYARVPRDILARPPAQSQGHGTEYHHHLRLLERPRAAAWRLRLHRQQRRRRIHSRSAAGRPLRQPAPRPLQLRRVGLRRLSRHGCSRTTRWSFAAAIPNSLPPPRAGCIASVRNSPRCKSAAAVPSSWCRSKTNTAASATTTHYINQIRQMIEDSGFTDAQLYTADGAEQMPNGSFPDSARRRQLRHRRSQSTPSRNCSRCAPISPTWPANTGTAGSITGAASTRPATRNSKSTSSAGSSIRATPSASTCFTAAPASAS